jgi:hypothetical protein
MTCKIFPETVIANVIERPLLGCVSTAPSRQATRPKHFARIEDNFAQRPVRSKRQTRTPKVQNVNPEEITRGHGPRKGTAISSNDNLPVTKEYLGVPNLQTKLPMQSKVKGMF